MLPEPPAPNVLQAMFSTMPLGNADASTPNGVLTAVALDAVAAALRPDLASVARLLASTCVLASLAVQVNQRTETPEIPADDCHHQR